MQKGYADYILQKTREDYNKIAEEFSATRAFVWEDIKPLARYVKDGDRVLDLGCGNGRLLQLFQGKDIEYIGLDNSRRLIEIAEKNFQFSISSDSVASPRQSRDNFQSISNFQFPIKPKFLVADALNLPFPDNYFDKIFSIAVLHHIPSEEYRLKFLQEAGRVLKPGGLLILTVWNLWHFGNFFRLLRPAKTNNPRLAIKYTLLKLLGKSKLDFGDVFVPWGKTCQRYVHQFTKKELKKLARKAGFKIEEIGVLPRPEMKDSNIYLIASK